MTSPVTGEPSSTTAKSATTDCAADRSLVPVDGSPSRNVCIAPTAAASAGSIFRAASALYAKASAAASAPLPAGTSYMNFLAGYLVKRQPFATIHGLRVGDATP